MNALFFYNKHYGQKALYAQTPFEVGRKLSFKQFIDRLTSSTTVVPYAPRRKAIQYGLLGTRAHPTTELHSATGQLDGNFTRSKEHIADKTKLLCIDLDTHLLLDVYGKLTGKVHEYIKAIPDEHNIKEFFATLGLNLNTLNHIIYKSTSYGKKVEYSKEHFTKKNMHIWLQLPRQLTYKEQITFIEALFAPINDIYPQRLRGLSYQLKPKTAPVLPDMAVYSAARLLVQGDLKGRIVSSNHKGKPISSVFMKRLLADHKEPPMTSLYTREELNTYAGDVFFFNKINETSYSEEEFKQRSIATSAVLQTGELFGDDPVYINNKYYSTFSLLREEMRALQLKDASGNTLFTEDKDVTTNISDILNPEKGHTSNCYAVLKPDGSMYVYHYSESRWFIVLQRDRTPTEGVYNIDRYIPTEHIQELTSNMCIIAPTGTGKTYHAIKKVLHYLEVGSLKKVVWTVPDYAALQSIEAEVLEIGTGNIKFKAVIAGKDKFDSFEENQFVICTMSKLNGELNGRTRAVPSLDHNRSKFATDGQGHQPYDVSEWSFVVDEVHTLFAARGAAERFMYYRILQRELLYDKLIVMSASMTEELLPGHHDRGWLATSQGKLTDWDVNVYHLKQPRNVEVTTRFPWAELLNPQTTSALVMAPTALKAVGIYEELKIAHPGKNILLYVGLPRNAAEMSIQEYPYKDKDGKIKFKQYERATNQELKEADFVVATALTAGTSLSRPYDYCVVDMQGIPHTLETRSVEVQKISRARHPRVKRILVISASRFERGAEQNLAPKALRTKNHPMNALDYEASKQLGVNQNRTNVLSPATHGTTEERLQQEAEVLEESPTFLKRHILTMEAPTSVKSQVERVLLAKFDIHKATSTYYQERDKFIAFSRESYEGAWGGGFTSYISEDSKGDALDLGTAHSKAVRDYISRIKHMSKQEFDDFMNTPPIDRAMDRAQQNIRKIEVPETPTCDPQIGLLPLIYVTNPESVKHYVWNPEFHQRMKQDADLAMRARRQNAILCSANLLYIQSVIEPDVFYPVSMVKDLLVKYVKYDETKDALSKIKKDPFKYLKRLGRVELFKCPKITLNRIMRPGDPGLAREPEQVSPKARKTATHFVFTLGWFSVHDEQYILDSDKILEPSIETPPAFTA